MIDYIIAAFPFVASDYRLHFPHMGRSPEHDVDEEAFVIVFNRDMPAIEPADPGTNNLCVYVGTPPDGDRIVYLNVDISDMVVALPSD